MSEEAKAKHEARLKRFNDAVGLQTPDRVPIIPWTYHFYPSRIAGISNKEAMYNQEKYFAALKADVLKHEFDMAPPTSIYPAQPWETLGLHHWKWPGGSLPDDSPFQYAEEEIISAEEYDDFLKNPDGFTLRTIFPRLATSLEPLAMTPPWHWYYNFPHLLAPYMAIPDYAAAWESLLKMGKEWAAAKELSNKCMGELDELGYPTVYGSVGFSGFDTVAIWLRGNKGTMLDMYRHPDKLLAAIDLSSEMQTQLSIIQCQFSGINRVSLFVYRGAKGFMSEEQFQKFFWPSLKQEVLDLLDADVVPMLFVEGDWTPRLETLAELPRGKVPIHFDRVDRRKAREILGDRNCFWGDVSTALMEHGTPQQVEDDVKELIDTFAGTGGLIVDCAGSITDDTKPENLTAMVEAVLKYGVN